MLIMLICLLISAGCSPSRRLARLLEKHPELKKADTVVVQDTVTVPGVVADTVVPVFGNRELGAGNREWGAGNREPGIGNGDSVLVEKGRLQVVVKKLHDTLFIRGKCKPDTVVIRRKIPVEKIVMAKPRTSWYLYVIIGLLVAMVFVMLWRRA